MCNVEYLAEFTYYQLVHILKFCFFFIYFRISKLALLQILFAIN